MRKYLWAQQFFFMLGAACLVASCQPKSSDKGPKNPCYEEETYSDFFEEDAFDSTITTEQEHFEEADEIVSEEESFSLQSEELANQHVQGGESLAYYGNEEEEISAQQTDVDSSFISEQQQHPDKAER